MSTKRKIRITIVEDEPLWQQGIQALLGFEPSIDLVATFMTSEDALAGIQAKSCDIVLMDWKLPGNLNGIELANELLKRGYAASQIILITGSPVDQLPENAYGYVSKPSIASQLIPTILSIAEVLSL